MAKWLKLYGVYKYFPPNLTHVTALPAKVRCSKLLHNVEMYYLQQTNKLSDD